VIFIETKLFTRTIEEHLSGEEYLALQSSLLSLPEQGVLISGLMGVRKLRWSIEGKGKRGGMRIIYYFNKPNHEIWMLAVYAKNQKSDLSSQDRATIIKIMDVIKNG
jgi:hypothetical protein